MSRLLIYFKDAVIRRNLHKQTACSYKLLSNDENTNNNDENNCGKQFKNFFLITASIFGLGLYLKYNNTNIGRKNVEPNKLLEKLKTLNECSTFTNCTVFRTFMYYISNSFNIFPKVHAATKISNSNDSLHGNRQKYNFIADVVSKVAPSVVYIEIKDTRRVDFFTGQPMTASNGSGFIIREDGLILTNAHVVINKPNSRVDVRLQNGTVYTGTVESVDSESDLATVRIPCKGLNPLILGKSSNILPGEWVVAIGSPLTLSNTVTAGVISSTDRGSDELGLRNKSMTYIQTDAAITFGNSGGPLVNLDGEVIGINSMKVTAGISFAIPSDYANEFLTRSKSQPSGDDLIPKRRYVGITMLTLTPEIVTELRQRKHSVPGDVTHGVLVWKVILGSPAHSGGLQPGDIVTHINGDAVKSAKDIYKVLSDSKARVLKMSVVRSTGLHTEVTVTPES